MTVNSASKTVILWKMMKMKKLMGAVPGRVPACPFARMETDEAEAGKIGSTLVGLKHDAMRDGLDDAVPIEARRRVDWSKDEKASRFAQDFMAFDAMTGRSSGQRKWVNANGQLHIDGNMARPVTSHVLDRREFLRRSACAGLPVALPRGRGAERPVSLLSPFDVGNQAQYSSMAF